VEAILVGGAVVTIYSENEYKSLDLDFVVRGRDAAIIKAMKSIGFAKGKGRHFEREGMPYFVEFLPPPVGIGNTIVTRFARRRTAGGLLTLYDPTHCVMDRLAAFCHWNDQQGLDQAVMVAKPAPHPDGGGAPMVGGRGHGRPFRGVPAGAGACQAIPMTVDSAFPGGNIVVDRVHGGRSSSTCLPPGGS
jgi:hypothetical protein